MIHVTCVLVFIYSFMVYGLLFIRVIVMLKLYDSVLINLFWNVSSLPTQLLKETKAILWGLKKLLEWMIHFTALQIRLTNNFLNISLFTKYNICVYVWDVILPSTDVSNTPHLEVIWLCMSSDLFINFACLCMRLCWKPLVNESEEDKKEKNSHYYMHFIRSTIKEQQIKIGGSKNSQ